METTLVEMFLHNEWANERLLDFCAELDDAVLDASSAGTYGTIRGALVHMLGAQERYVTLLTEKRRENPVHERKPWPGFDGLRESSRWSCAALLDLAENDPHETILRGERGGEPYAMRAATPMVQAIHHANEHRTHVTSLLGQQGIEPPELSAWLYALENHPESM